ncbi:MAG TPA: tetratricopeptide repeat protein, partial [Acetobacteraceae bacterium]
ARGDMALAEHQVRTGAITPAQAAEKLERLRFAWRGDELELDIVERLGDTYIQAGNYPAGFDTLRQAAALNPDNPRAARITERMSKVFTDLFSRDGAAKLKPLEALGLYDQFKELTPVGAAGDAVIRNLAERLVEIDLLGRAAELLQHQVDYRLQGVDKGKVGARLAAIRLLDSKPDDALKALDASTVPDLPADLQAERRVLRARALSQLKRPAEALALLAQDSSLPAEMLRVDIAWRAGQWADAATALVKVIGPPPAADAPLPRETGKLVLNRAVALALAGDAPALEKLRSDFGPVMGKGPDADSFRVLTRPGQAGGLIDMASIRSRVREVDVFQSFLAGYRKKTTPEG